MGPLEVEGRTFCRRLGERGPLPWKRAVESMLSRREKRFLVVVEGVTFAFDARLEAVEMDQRLRFRKPSLRPLRPPRLLDLECVLEEEPRRVFLGETLSSRSRSVTESAQEEALALKGSLRAGCCFQLVSLTVMRGGGSRDEDRGREAGEKTDWG